ncbi:MAG: hypothetical protein ACRCZW_11030, partial [Lactobacillaceae bacterium]
FHLCADIDFTRFRASIVLDVFNKFKTHHDTLTKIIMAEHTFTKSDIDFWINVLFWGAMIVKPIDFKSHPDKTTDEEKDLKVNMLNEFFSKKLKDDENRYAATSSKCILLISIFENKAIEIFNIIKEKYPSCFNKHSIEYIKSLSDSILEPDLDMKDIYIYNHIDLNNLNNEKIKRIISLISIQNDFPFLIIENIEKEIFRINQDASNGVDELLFGLCK